MALFSGYVVLPTDSYFSWKNAVIGNGYDADGYYGYQCWDLCAEFWWNVGFPTGYPRTGPNSSAYECWTVSRFINASYDGTTYFDLIENVNDIKQGDVIVWSVWNGFTYGHIGFADEDYNGSGSIAVLAQNQGSGGTPPPVFPSAGGSTANVKTLTLYNFLGAFRYKAWHTPTPTVISSPTPEAKFPWPVYARKLRGQR